MKQKTYFSFKEESIQFNQSLAELIHYLSKQEQAKIIPPENIMNYNHGENWLSINSNTEEKESEMKIHSSEVKIDFEDVVNHNLSILPNLISENVLSFATHFKQLLHSTISSSCEESGNTIHSKDYPDSADAFMAILQKIEFGVDRSGNLSYPEIHLRSQEQIDKLINDIELKDEEFKQKLNQLIESKSKAAIAREEIRKNKFE